MRLVCFGRALPFVVVCWALSATACQPKKTAAHPSATGSKPTPAKIDSTETEDSDLKKDAMEAMVILAGRWAMQGISPGSPEPPSGWHRHEASGTCMPKGSKSWELTDERTYGPNDESVSMWNESKKTQVTLYTYPAHGALDAEFDDVMAQMAHTCTEGPVMTTVLGGTHLGGCPRRLDNGMILLEQAVLFQRGPWLHKARITFAAAGTDSAYPAAMSLISQAFGACGSKPASPRSTA